MSNLFLLVILVTMPGHGVSVTTAEMPDQGTCQAAAARIESELVLNAVFSSSSRVKAICVKRERT